MEFTTITQYIEGIYQNDDMLKQDEFISRTEPGDFCPVIETETARLLMLLLRLKKPEKVLEIGTSIGYSTVTMAKTISEWNGKIITIEFDDKIAEKAKKNFKMYGVDQSIELRFGDARKILHEMNEQFDFIFLDPYNDIYPELYEDCVRLLNKGGILIADDILMPLKAEDLNNNCLHKYSSLIAGNKNLVSTIIASGDGVSLAVKK